MLLLFRRDATLATAETLFLRLPDIFILDPERIRANRLQIRRSLPDSDPLLNILFDNFALKFIISIVDFINFNIVHYKRYFYFMA
jgi:hypothetical protein